MEGVWWSWGITLLFTILAGRIFWVLYNTGRPVSSQLHVKSQPKRTLIVLGSGGHTAEMLSLVRSMNLQQYAPRHYIAGATDKMSLSRAEREESQLVKDSQFADEDIGDAARSRSLQTSRYSQIYRSREVGQSYVTSVFTTLWAFAHAFLQVLRICPDVILCNGPGTCLPICAAGFLLKVVGLRCVVVVYVESIARVKKLSLTGLLLYKLRLADQFFVQWQDLKLKYPRANYVGRMM